MVFFDMGSVKKKGIKDQYDVVVVGAGPAGLASAIYARRAGLSVLVVEKAIEGGYVNLTHLVENYPGFPKISGEELASKFKEHAESFGADIYNAEVVRLEIQEDRKVVELDDGKKIEAPVVIVATGADPKKLNIPGEKEFFGKGVSYCATCDGYLFSGKDIVVVGGGDSACDESIFLSNIVNKITMVQLLETLTAAKVLQERVLNNPKIDVVFNSTVKEIRGKDKVEEIVIENVKTGETKVLKADGVFIFIGLDPNSKLLEGLVELDPYGYVVTDENMETSIKGLYAVGDVRKKNLRQIVTAVADGAIAVEHAAKHYF
ncbi:thioredoxin-disulfide reductase [Thermotoga sp.]|uniref:thioredoxin-disulfide reductase n=1 Tax=Thermotoga sp. TaxID=28240 RepID=UPI0025E09B13|nr:thioredoxin-disulfide reductase [Thermotoga sp.]MCD6550975.1 thioredoxin-disulfide reductase [Thermotoga sp.]